MLEKTPTIKNLQCKIDELKDDVKTLNASIHAILELKDRMIKYEEEIMYQEQEKLRKLQADKEMATKNGEPWVTVIDMEVNFDQMDQGSFELDWNEFFISQLLKCGYTGASDAEIVDQWFTTVCQNVAMLNQFATDNTPKIRGPITSRMINDTTREYK